MNPRVLDFDSLTVLGGLRSSVGDAYEFRIGDEAAQRVAKVQLSGELGLTRAQAEGVAEAVRDALIFLGGAT